MGRFLLLLLVAAATVLPVSAQTSDLFDRSIGTRFATKSINELIRLCEEDLNECYFIGMHEGKMEFIDLFEFPRMVDEQYQRPKQQWWMQLKDLAKVFERYNVSNGKKKK